jgi:superfamily II DNA/RNA helicase
MQAAANLPPEQRDPWWTTMSFFSSLRELGNALTLFQSDVPDYLITIKNRQHISSDQLRKLWNVTELTGRLSSDEVPRKLQELEVPAGSVKPYPIDACLASTMVEVGVDIERLSLMTVLGQPKTTSTYIQVTGRIGRRWWERPGLVVTMLSPHRPRDRSHFERFRSYHERLYAQVEPTSVTPFSPPALDRALHAVVATYVRHRGEAERVASPFPAPTELLDEAHELLLRRLKGIEPSEQEEFEKIFEKRRSEWEHWQRSQWGTPFATAEDGLLRSSMGYASGTAAILSWPTPTSMRSVDAECRAEITQEYAVEGGAVDGEG